MKVIIAGSRTLNASSKLLSETIKLSGFKMTQLVSGGAMGVDSNAEMYCLDRGIRTTGPEFYISGWVWDVLGKKAGPIRNAAMAEYADALIAIWDGKSRGTKNMIDTMKVLSKPVYVWRTDAGQNETV